MPDASAPSKSSDVTISGENLIFHSGDPTAVSLHKAPNVRYDGEKFTVTSQGTEKNESTDVRKVDDSTWELRGDQYLRIESVGDMFGTNTGQASQEARWVKVPRQFDDIVDQNWDASEEDVECLTTVYPVHKRLMKERESWVESTKHPWTDKDFEGEPERFTGPHGSLMTGTSSAETVSPAATVQALKGQEEGNQGE